MAFGGTAGPSGALIPATNIVNIKGEFGVSYDALGRIAFQTSSGTIYTPERVDTLFIAIATDANAPQPEPLGDLLVGNANNANADTGTLVTAIPAANEHGLPTNFGPGRGEWDNPTGQQRLRVSPQQTLNVAVPAAGLGSVVCAYGAGGADAGASVRNFHGEPLSTLVLVVECVHSVQG